MPSQHNKPTVLLITFINSVTSEDNLKWIEICMAEQMTQKLLGCNTIMYTFEMDRHVQPCAAVKTAV